MAKCISCNRRCYEDHLFCKSCFFEYKNRPIAIEIDDEGKIEFLDGDLDQSNDCSSNCLICGEDTDGYFFCKSCYHKYKNKTIFLSVKNCEDVEVLDSPPTNPPALFSARSQAKFEAAKKHQAEDGHMLRSPQEVIIDNLLYNARIIHTYEKPLEYNKDNGYPILPDWFVPVLDNSRGVYIEYYGVTDKKAYNRRRERNQTVYDREEIPVIGIEADEVGNLPQLQKRIIMELNRLSLQHFGVQRFIK